MNSLQEIEAALPTLTPDELRRLLRRADELFREKKGAAIYDDAYGVVTEADLIVSGDQAFLAYDREEETPL